MNLIYAKSLCGKSIYHYIENIYRILKEKIHESRADLLLILVLNSSIKSNNQLKINSISLFLLSNRQ